MRHGFTSVEAVVHSPIEEVVVQDGRVVVEDVFVFRLSYDLVVVHPLKRFFLLASAQVRLRLWPPHSLQRVVLVVWYPAIRLVVRLVQRVLPLLLIIIARPDVAQVGEGHFWGCLSVEFWNRCSVGPLEPLLLLLWAKSHHTTIVLFFLIPSTHISWQLPSTSADRRLVLLLICRLVKMLQVLW